MPPPRYLWVHDESRLPAADLDLLKQWARIRVSPPSGQIIQVTAFSSYQDLSRVGGAGKRNGLARAGLCCASGDCAFRSFGSAVRKLGAPVEARVFFGQGCNGCQFEQANTPARRMQTVLGKSPLSYFQSLRVERAVHLLKPAMPASTRSRCAWDTRKARFCVSR